MCGVNAAQGELRPATGGLLIGPDREREIKTEREREREQ